MSPMKKTMSLLGAALGAGLIVQTMAHGNLIPIFLNAHGIVMVFGGTIAALMIATPAEVLSTAIREAGYVFFPPETAQNKELSAALVELSAQVRKDGLRALQQYTENPESVNDGFLFFAIEVALENGEQPRLRKVLEDGLRQREAALNRAAAVFQSGAMLAPMFGLLGTVMGIVGVLKDISNPQTIGPSMAIAMTTAFYGILLAAFVFNPVALRVRARAQELRRSYELIMEGILNILAGAVPLQVERHLKAYNEES